MAPDPCFVYMSEHHREALGHLLFGLGEGGGFVQLTGEVGTGKTTICRTLLSQVPDNVDVALIFNPKLTVTELLQTICEELRIESGAGGTSTKAYVDRLYTYLLEANAKGRRTILIIDEAQSLSSEVLEQIRLLTNLETNENKLLQVFLIGQPELRSFLDREDLRQVAQRITARYHLEPLSRTETEHYIRHRLSVAGCERSVFSAAAVRKIYRLTGGIPRLVNSLCDRALLGAYTTERQSVDSRIVARAQRELRGESNPSVPLKFRYLALGCAAAAVLATGLLAMNTGDGFLSVLTARASRVAATSEVLDSHVERAPTPPAPGLASTEPEPTATTRTNPAVLLPGEDESVAPVRVSTPDRDRAPGLAFEQVSDQAAVKRASSQYETIASPTVGERPRGAAFPQRALSEHLDSLESDASNRAEQRLFALWNAPRPAHEGDLCGHAAGRGLNCFAKAGSWDQLRGFDLPALLTLQRDGDGPVRVLLVGLAGQDATLWFDGQRHIYPLHEVDRYWTGEFVLLWKPPLGHVTVIRPSHFGEPVRWLRTLLARVDGVETQAANPASFDAVLTERIKRFQRRRGLYADGIVGPQTLIHLTTLIRDPDKPTLSAAALSAAHRPTPAVAYLRQ